MIGVPALVVIGAYLFIRASGKKAAVEKFNYALEGIPQISYQGGNAVITFNLLISNPSPESFTVSRVAADVFIGSTFVGNVESKRGFSIGAYGQGRPQLDMTVTLNNAALSLIDAIANPGNGFTVKMVGGVQMPGITVPLEVTLKL